MYKNISRKFPIWRDAELLVAGLEEAVARFPRYHKYSLGTELRRNAMNILRCVTHAINNKQQRARWVHRLVTMIDDCKLRLQIAKSVHAFNSFAQFEALAKIAVNLSRQACAWRAKLQRPDQQGA